MYLCTQGYKNIYHKEEYKRKKKFYDDKDLKKHFDKKGKGKKKYKADKGHQHKTDESKVSSINWFLFFQ